MRWKRWVLAGAIVLTGLPGVAWAESEVDILINKLVEKGILSKVEAGLIRREMSETKEARNKQLAKEIVPESARNWKWKGDIRLRDEYRNRAGTGADVNRQRIRFRYGVEAKVNDQMKVVGRLATGTTFDFESGSQSDNTDIQKAEPISTNDSFDDFFRKKPIGLDLAYLDYTPEIPGVTKFEVVGGIMDNPQWTVSPMVWDPDLSWDGAAVKVSQDFTPMVTAFANNGVFALDTDETEASALWVTQWGAALKPFADSEDEVLKNFKVTGALAWDDYVNTTTSAKAGTDPISRVSTNSAGVADFNLLNPNLEIASQVNEIPISLFSDWVRNTEATSKTRDGYALGMKVGKALNPWDLKKGWEAGYFFERLESDAAFDEFADSDFIGGGTNRRGNVAWVTLAVLKNSTLGAKYFWGHELLGAKANEDRLQLDWVTKF